MFEQNNHGQSSTGIVLSPVNRVPSVEFRNILEPLSILDVTYISYTLTGVGKRIHFHSDQAWAKIFLDEGLVNNCPLDQICHTVPFSIIRWNFLSGLTRKQQQVMFARTDLNIRNGITITQRINNINEMVAFATKHQKIKVDNVVLEKLDLFKEVIVDLRNVAFCGLRREIHLTKWPSPPNYRSH